MKSRRKMRKKAQHTINKNIRAINRNIEEDNSWRGRFVMRQVNARWSPFDDGSGGELLATILMIDKRTGYTKTTYLDNYNNSWRYFVAMNNFIVDDCAVWEKEGRDFLYSDKTDYTKISIEKRLQN